MKFHPSRVYDFGPKTGKTLRRRYHFGGNMVSRFLILLR